mmetsp:Transcript_31081/g.88150  ORF Transcript_31081/g.88150 Transcript_31081/m.88150 type:complete len:274 (+) Transcript_31081:911-1732(+)
MSSFEALLLGGPRSSSREDSLLGRGLLGPPPPVRSSASWHNSAPAAGWLSPGGALTMARSSSREISRGGALPPPPPPCACAMLASSPSRDTCRCGGPCFASRMSTSLEGEPSSSRSARGSFQCPAARGLKPSACPPLLEPYRGDIRPGWSAAWLSLESAVISPFLGSSFSVSAVLQVLVPPCIPCILMRFFSALIFVRAAAPVCSWPGGGGVERDGRWSFCSSPEAAPSEIRETKDGCLGSSWPREALFSEGTSPLSSSSPPFPVLSFLGGGV